MKNLIPLLKRRATILSIYIFSTDEIHILQLKSETESFLESSSHYYAQTALEVPALPFMGRSAVSIRGSDFSLRIFYCVKEIPTLGIVLYVLTTL